MNLFDVFNEYEVTNVTDDTRNVVEGSVFVAIRGESFNGEAAAADMLARGAVAVITQRDLGLGERQILVENARLAYAQAVSRFFGNPTARLKLIAVTGTNGKSTVASLIKELIDSAGHKCGFIGTTCYDTCGSTYEAHLSTPRQDELYRLFAEMRDNGADYCVMEASSQALDQYRIAGEMFEVGIFTNLTQDHLDWHKTMENYYQAKKMLFAMCKSALICVDDDWGKRLADELTAESAIPVETYSISQTRAAVRRASPVGRQLDDKSTADYYAVNIKTTSSAVSYWFNDTDSEKSYLVRFKMPGLFNAANSIAAIAACKRVGVDSADCIAALESCSGVRGRCEVIHDGLFTVICDYAHTEDALAKILTCVRQSVSDKGRIICLFGAAGERDVDKRPLMGATAARYSDFLVVTSDNPRHESPQKIIDEVTAGVPAHIPCETFTDRREAIEFALTEAREGDTVLLAGKGHETYQVIGDDYLPFDERLTVKAILEAQ
jgi:UDP-N-acetylmuramoyl-L-alanyl-D-glutamate--2,6-diaminopimelate ligase